MALPMLNTLIAGSDAINDTGIIGFRLTDTDGINDDTNAFLFLENAGFASSNILMNILVACVSAWSSR